MKVLMPLFLLLSILPLHAADHQLSSIRVRGNKRASTALILAQSRLKEGNTYTETTLTNAVRRVARLPFVFGATYQLEGSDGDGETLIIQVSEQRRYQISWATEMYTDTHHNVWNDELGLSADWFPGSGHISLSVNADPSLTQDHEDPEKTTLAYELYNIGRGVRMRLFSDNYADYNGFNFFTEDSYTFGFGQIFNKVGIELGVPLNVNSSIGFQVSRVEKHIATFDYYSDVFTYHSTDTDGMETRVWWDHDTRDDEVVPLSGSFFRVGGFIRALETDYLYIDDNDGDIDLSLGEDGDAKGAFMEAAYYKPYGDKGSFSYKGGATWEETDVAYSWDEANPRESSAVYFESAFTWHLSGRDGSSRESFLQAIAAAEWRERDYFYGSDDVSGVWLGGAYTYRGRRFLVNLKALYTP